MDDTIKKLEFTKFIDNTTEICIVYVTYTNELKVTSIPDDKLFRKKLNSKDFYISLDGKFRNFDIYQVHNTDIYIIDIKERSLKTNQEIYKEESEKIRLCYDMISQFRKQEKGTITPLINYKFMTIDYKTISKYTNIITYDGLYLLYP